MDAAGKKEPQAPGPGGLEGLRPGALGHTGGPAGLPPALASAGVAVDLQGLQGQVELDTAALSAALSLGQDSTVLAQFQRGLDTSASLPNDISTILAASIGLLPQQALGGGAPGAGPLDNGAASVSAALNVQQLLQSAANVQQNHLHETGSGVPGGGPPDEGDVHEQQSDGSRDDEDGPLKKKPALSEEDRKRRRQEINRQSARRIRERRAQEMEQLKAQVVSLQSQQALLLRYAAQLAREKNMLVQRTLELTERWNQAAAENLELRARVQGSADGGPPVTAPPLVPPSGMGAPA